MIKRMMDEYYDCEWDKIETPHDVATASDSFLVESDPCSAILEAIGVFIIMFLFVL